MHRWAVVARRADPSEVGESKVLVGVVHVGRSNKKEPGLSGSQWRFLPLFGLSRSSRASYLGRPRARLFNNFLFGTL